jgi:hypothetical protein
MVALTNNIKDLSPLMAAVNEAIQIQPAEVKYVGR